MSNREQFIKDRDNAILVSRRALEKEYYVMDNETTGLADEGGQICQTGLLFSNGKTFNSFVKATVPITNGANKVHLITDYDCRNAPDILEIYKHIPYGMNVIIYNKKFDLKALENSLKAKGEEFNRNHFGTIYDAMRIFAAFYGEWNDYFNDYKWKKLVRACYLCGIELDLPAHDALSDAIMTNEVIKYIANQELYMG